MTNILARVRFTVDLPESKIEALVGRPDDGSDDYYSEACAKAEEWVQDNAVGALEYAGEPDVDVD